MTRTTTIAAILAALAAATAAGNEWRIADADWQVTTEPSGVKLIFTDGESHLGRTWRIFDKCTDEFGWAAVPLDDKDRGRPDTWYGFGYSLAYDREAGIGEGWTVPVTIENDQGFRDELVVNVNHNRVLAYRHWDSTSLARSRRKRRDVRWQAPNAHGRRRRVGIRRAHHHHL